VPARFAVFELDQVQDFVLPLEQEIVKTEKDARSLPKRAFRPARLRGTGAGERQLDILHPARRKTPQRSTGKWRGYCNFPVLIAA
jgi:hypothetical protein